MSKPRVIGKYKASDCIPTGCSVLNLYLSGNVFGGWVKGHMGNIVGDSDAGKSLVGLTTLAEAAHTPSLNDYDLHQDDTESSNTFPIEDMFGQLAERLGNGGDGEEGSDLIEEFYHKVLKLLDKGDPIVYVLDSMDGLDTVADVAKFRKNMNKIADGNDATGSYGDGKAKINSTNLRKLRPLLRKTGSLLLIISQTRDNIGTSFVAKTRAGGKALKFYACWELWLAVKGPITKTVAKMKRQIGTRVVVKVSKNHATGKHGKFEIPMYYGYGIDDVRCCIEWLCQEMYWKMNSGSVSTQGEFGDQKVWKAAALAQHCKDPQNYKKLRRVVQTAWDEIEAGLRMQGRYAVKAHSSKQTKTDAVEAGFTL